MMGNQQEKVGDVDGAFASYNKAIEDASSIMSMQSENVPAIEAAAIALVLKAKLLYKVGEIGEAADCLNDYFDAVGKHRWDATACMVKVHLWGPSPVRDPGKALTMVVELLEDHPNKIEINFLYALSLLDVGQVSKAVEASDRVSKLARAKQAECFLRSIAYSKMGELEKARIEYKAGVEFMSNSSGKSKSLGLEQFEMEGLKTRSKQLLKD